MRYYSIHRPVAPGTFPKTVKVNEIHNCPALTYFPEIGRGAWGWIDYADELDEKDARAYELVKYDSTE